MSPNSRKNCRHHQNQTCRVLLTSYNVSNTPRPTVLQEALYAENHEVRQVRLNELHPAQLTPSWYGNSVGHYEGDTLVIDTVGIKIGPFAMIDWYGTPYTKFLHVVERYRLIDFPDRK